MNAWLSFIQVWLIDLAFLTTALLAAAILLRLVLRDAKSRVLLAWGTWLGIAAAALVTLLPGWPRYEWSALARALSGEANVDIEDMWAARPPVIVDRSFAADPLAAAAPVADDTRGEPLRMNWSGLAAFAWIGSATLGFAWIALGCRQARRLLRQSQTAPRWILDELSQICQGAVGNALRGVPSWRRGLPDVRTSASLTSAVALRARKPAILLPRESADPSSTKAVRAALAHEWAHIRHGDLWLLALERLLLPLLALHPLFWWLRRSTRLDQELLADAAAAGDKPVEYAEALVAWAKTSAPPPAALAALAFWDRPSNLTRRVHMILHKPRPAITWFGRLLSVAALACLLALVGGLSLFTLRPLAADDEPGQPQATSNQPLADHPPLPVDAGEAKASIELEFTIIEADGRQLAEVLPVVGPQPNPEIDISFHSPEAWSDVLLQLLEQKAAAVISNPRLITQSGQEAVVQIGAVAERDERKDGAVGAELKETSLSISVVPKLVTNNGQHHVQLQLDAAVGELPLAAAAPPLERRKREVRVMVNVPLGKTVAIGRRSLDISQRAVVLAVHPRLVAKWEATRKATPEEAARFQSLAEARQQLTRQVQAGEPESRREAAAVRHSLLRLQREIAALLEQTAGKADTATDPSGAPAKSAADPFGSPANAAAGPFGSDPFGATKAQSSKRGKAAGPSETRNPPQFVPVTGDPEKALTQVQLRMKELKIDGVTIGVDSKRGSLIVSGSEQQVGEVHKVLLELDRTAAATTEQQLQQKLLELDLREAEIGLQAAKAEHEQMAEIRSKSQSAVSNSELRHSQLKVELAQVQVERMKVRIEAARAATPPATPAAPRRQR